MKLTPRATLARKLSPKPEVTAAVPTQSLPGGRGTVAALNSDGTLGVTYNGTIIPCHRAGDFVASVGEGVWVLLFGTLNVAMSAPSEDPGEEVTVVYDPATEGGVTLGGAFVDIDATHLMIPFTTPPTGCVVVSFECLAAVTGGAAYQLGVNESGSQVGHAVIVSNPASTYTERFHTEIPIFGLAPGSDHTFTIAGGSFLGHATNLYYGGNGLGGNMTNNAGPAILKVKPATILA